MSINVELPTDAAVSQYAPEKNPAQIRKAMGFVKLQKQSSGERSFSGKRPPKFAPAGQSTQVIIGADASNDATILGQSTRLYASYGLKRVYYSAFSPIPDSSKNLPLIRPPLQREHRLYQADWLLRFYGFELDEITGVTSDGNLELDFDPKLAWALAHRGLFPLDVNSASRELLLRVPGFGVKTVKRILATRRHRRLRYEDLTRMGVSMKKARAFVTAAGWSPGALTDSAGLRASFAPPPQQLSLL